MSPLNAQSRLENKEIEDLLIDLDEELEKPRATMQSGQRHDETSRNIFLACRSISTVFVTDCLLSGTIHSGMQQQIISSFSRAQAILLSDADKRDASQIGEYMTEILNMERTLLEIENDIDEGQNMPEFVNRMAIYHLFN